MNLKSIKSTADLKLDGITFDCEWRDKQLHGVTMRDASGRIVRVALDSYSLRAYVPAPPETKTVHVVTGTVRGVGTEIREQFDDPYEANSRKNEIEQADVCEVVTVKSEEVEIPF